MSNSATLAHPASPTCEPTGRRATAEALEFFASLGAEPSTFDHGLRGERADAAARWHVLHTVSRQEKVVSRELAARGVVHYLPTSALAGYHGRGQWRRRVLVDQPIFPGYVFMYGGLHETYAADRAGRLAHVLPVADQDALEQDLLALWQLLRTGEGFDLYPHLRQGVRVVVIEGRLRGLQGLIAERNDAGRLVVQVEVLRQAVVVELDGAAVEIV